jgi:hypothetical protein
MWDLMNGTNPAVCCEGASGKVQLNIRPLWMQRVIGADEGHSANAVVGVLSSAVDEIIPPGLADETFAVLRRVISLNKCVTFKSSG